MTTYCYTKGQERWKIASQQSDPLSRWQLSHADNEAWRGLRLFTTVEAAMSAVAKGKTGVDSWDAAAHVATDYSPDQWSIESW